MDNNVNVDYRPIDKSIIIHVPHASVEFPEEIENRFLVDMEYIGKRTDGWLFQFFRFFETFWYALWHKS